MKCSVRNTDLEDMHDSKPERCMRNESERVRLVRVNSFEGGHHEDVQKLNFTIHMQGKISKTLRSQYPS